MKKDYIEVVVAPRFSFPEKLELTMDLDETMYHRRRYVVKSHPEPYDPAARNVRTAVEQTLSLTDVFPEHRITYRSFPNGKREISVVPASQAKRR